jgi:hypothetical protein
VVDLDEVRATSGAEAARLVVEQAVAAEARLVEQARSAEEAEQARPTGRRCRGRAGTPRRRSALGCRSEQTGSKRKPLPSSRAARLRKAGCRRRAEQARLTTSPLAPPTAEQTGRRRPPRAEASRHGSTTKPSRPRLAKARRARRGRAGRLDEEARLAAEAEQARLDEDARRAAEAEQARLDGEAQQARLDEDATAPPRPSGHASTKKRGWQPKPSRPGSPRTPAAPPKPSRHGSPRTPAAPAEAEQARLDEKHAAAAEAEQAWLAEEARQAEHARQAAEAEQARLAEDARLAAQAEQARLDEDARLATEARTARISEEARVDLEAAAQQRAADDGAPGGQDHRYDATFDPALHAAAFAELSASAAGHVPERPVPTAPDHGQPAEDRYQDEEPFQPFVAPDTDTAALLRELSSLGLDDDPPPPPVRPAPPRPVSTLPAKKRKGLFGR